MDRSIAGLVGQFLGAVQDADTKRACRLLTDDERSRLGGEAACRARLATVAERLRPEREPFVDSLSLGFGNAPRGDFSIVLRKPFERIGIRFEPEQGRWRVTNTRDLFRQR